MSYSLEHLISGHATAPEQTAAALQRDVSVPNLDDSQLYINWELSWLAFNERVLMEASSSEHPLLERVKFLAIAANNLDESFMIRVATKHPNQSR
jgi:polyphosphate kinase